MKRKERKEKKRKEKKRKEKKRKRKEKSKEKKKEKGKSLDHCLENIPLFRSNFSVFFFFFLFLFFPLGTLFPSLLPLPLPFSPLPLSSLSSYFLV